MSESVAGLNEEPTGDVEQTEPTDRIVELEALVNERTEDLQRVQAEYINYKRRVDRDRDGARKAGVVAVMRDLIPVFDSILAAKAHGELTGGFKLTADELEKVTTHFGFSHFGKAGDEFDPKLHEALMQSPVPGTGEMSVKEVLQVGYRLDDLIMRPARVVVAVPDGSETAGEDQLANKDESENSEESSE